MKKSFILLFLSLAFITGCSAGKNTKTESVSSPESETVTTETITSEETTSASEETSTETGHSVELPWI